MNHTPEPWQLEGNFGCRDDLMVFTFTSNEAMDPDLNEANARRIVACVNACAGIPTEVLEKWGKAPIIKDAVAPLISDMIATGEVSVKKSSPHIHFVRIGHHQQRNSFNLYENANGTYSLYGPTRKGIEEWIGDYKSKDDPDIAVHALEWREGW